MMRVVTALFLALASGLVGCAKPPAPEEALAPDPGAMDAASQPAQPVGDLTGDIKIDGSSTVYPITEAVAEEFRKVQPNVNVTVGIAGTGGGFKRFTALETDISDASRPIKEKEHEAAKTAGLEFVELPVAFDGLSVMVNPANDWCEYLTVAELKAIWEPSSQIKNWQDVRAGFPDQELKLYGPGTDSGTFDYFTEAICGKEGEARSDFTPSEDDNVLVLGVAGDKGALGFFGFAYYVQNQDKLKLVGIDPGDGQPVKPSEQTINDGSYQPLSRPIFIYVSVKAAERPEVDAFVRFYLEQAATLVGDVGYVALPAEAYQHATARYDGKQTGSIFSGGSQPGLSIVDILKQG